MTMTIEKVRIAIAVFLAALSVGMAGQLASAGSAEAAKIASHPTGDTDLDRYCSDLAGLVNSALDNENAARAEGRTASADAWRSYANALLAAGRSRGCDWYAARRIKLGRAGTRVTGVTQVTSPTQVTGSARVTSSTRLASLAG